jgi:hypothetical protein
MPIRTSAKNPAVIANQDPKASLDHQRKYFVNRVDAYGQHRKSLGNIRRVPAPIPVKNTRFQLKNFATDIAWPLNNEAFSFSAKPESYGVKEQLVLKSLPPISRSRVDSSTSLRQDRGPKVSAQVNDDTGKSGKTTAKSQPESSHFSEGGSKSAPSTSTMTPKKKVNLKLCP